MLALMAAPATAAEDGPMVRGTGDLGLIVERDQGRVAVVDTTADERLCRIDGLGDLSHASAVFARDARHAFIFGRDGGLSRVDLLGCEVTHRRKQAGNSIGGAISQDGGLVAVSNYEPGGVRVFDSNTLEPVTRIPARMPDGERSKVVGLVDAPGDRFVFSLYEGDAIWIADFSDSRTDPEITRIPDVGDRPYDALLTPGGRYYVAGLYGEDGLALVDLWHPEDGARTILPHYGRGEKDMPVYKMPHLEGWAVAGDKAFLPAVGQHQVLVVNTNTWEEAGRIDVAGQPVFAMARPDGRRVWVNFAVPDNDTVQILDTETLEVTDTLHPGPAVLHMAFEPRGSAVWLSVRDAGRVKVYDPYSLDRVGGFDLSAPSGIFFTHRAHETGL